MDIITENVLGITHFFIHSSKACQMGTLNTWPEETMQTAIAYSITDAILRKKWPTCRACKLTKLALATTGLGILTPNEDSKQDDIPS